MKYYVYNLIDPRTETIFYVGKGCRSRRFRHEIDAKRGKPGAKCDLIREILAAGHAPRAVIVSRHADGFSALKAEANQIFKIGIRNLTNINGGGGPIGKPSPPFTWTVGKLRHYAKTLNRMAAWLQYEGPLMVGAYDFREPIKVAFCRIIQDVGAEGLGEAMGIQ